MDFLLAVLSFVIVLTPLILIHEWGHFIACRLTGVTVLEFGLGFPPRAAKLFERNGTEFTLNWLPLGGFVRPLGEDFVRPVGEEATERERQAYRRYQKSWRRSAEKCEAEICGRGDAAAAAVFPRGRLRHERGSGSCAADHRCDHLLAACGVGSGA
jgi:RIP metalloprotease RseP